jgi:serine/threonine protein kinase
MPTCARCHRDVVAGAHFCGACGAPVFSFRASEEGADPTIGQTVKGTYFIQRRVGGGGMGDVYKALHVALDKPIALKLLKKSLLADATLVQRFYREARAASKLRHPNVISVTDFGQTEDGTLFMAMEYLAGKNLARIIAEEQPLSEKRIVRIGAQVLAALAEAHAAGILHRDLKPENVMVESRRDEPDSVKVLDFGIAKIQTADADESQTALTQAGLVCGTPGYMSPEQWGEETLDTRSDLYAVGVLLYEMLTGKLPFEAATPLELARKQRAERPQPPSARRAVRAVSDDLERLVMRALSPDRKDRPASAEEMRSDLLSCVLLPNPEAPGAAGDGAAKENDNETVAFYHLSVRRVPSPPPGPRRTPGQGTGLRTPPKQIRAPTPPKENRPRNPAPPRPASTPSRANLPRATDGSAEAATIPWLKSQRVGLVAGVIAGVVALAMAFVIAQWPRRNSAFTPDAGPAATPSPTPKPTLAPWLSSPLEPVATPAPSLPASEATPPPEPTPAPKPIIPPATPTATLAPKLPRVQCASPLHYQHGLGKISTPPPASGEGVLVVRALPWGQVFVCASAYGEAPVELKVKAGTYQVRVDHGATSKRSQVIVEPGARAAVAVDFSRTK